MIQNDAGYHASARGFGDSLQVAAGENEGGSFDVTVSRPWYTAVTLRRVLVPEDVCGISGPERVEARLALLPGAPPVRQVVTPTTEYGFGWGDMQDALPAQAVAAPGVSQEVVWVARDTSVIRLEANGSLTTRCRTTPGQTWAVARSVVDPSKRDSILVSVDADQDPGRCPRP